MSEKKHGPGPSYPQVPPTSNGHNVPYPIQQGPPMPPQGAPPAYTPMPPQGHIGYPQQPYYPANAVPQPYPAYGQPPQGYPPQTQPGQYPTTPGMPGAYMPGAPAAYPAPPGQVQAYPAPPGQVFVPGLFDAGARFDRNAQPNIPPPPPGYAPNAAQMAAMQGHQVTGTQQRSNIFTDGAGGGPTQCPSTTPPTVNHPRATPLRLNLDNTPPLRACLGPTCQVPLRPTLLLQHRWLYLDCLMLVLALVEQLHPIFHLPHQGTAPTQPRWQQCRVTKSQERSKGATSGQTGLEVACLSGRNIHTSSQHCVGSEQPCAVFSCTSKTLDVMTEMNS